MNLVTPRAGRRHPTAIFVLGITLAASSQVKAQVTEFDNIALDGSGSTPFIRLDHTGDPSQFIVGFNDNIALFDGNSYSFRLFQDAPAGAMTIDSSGVSILNALTTTGSTGTIRNPMVHATTNQVYGIATLDENTGLFGGGIGLYTDTALYPFYVFSGAASESLAVQELGVGVGTYSAESALTVYSDGTPYDEAKILVENDLAVAPRTLLELRNPGNTKFEINNTDAGNSWAFTNSGSDFRVSLQGSGVVEFRVDNNGNAFIDGDLDVGGSVITNLAMPSDRELKQKLESLDPSEVLDQVVALPLSTWEYKDRPGQRHLGPMAQDFHRAFGLGDSDKTISSVDATGVALASIQALEARNLELEQRVEMLEALVAELLPRSAQR